MANGTLELAPPNEGGDDRNTDVLRHRVNEMLTTEYPTLDETELDRLLDGDVDTATDQKSSAIPAQRQPDHDSLRYGGDSTNVSHEVTRVPEPIVFTEFQVGERGLSRRYRQKALGINAGYLMLRRQHLMPQRRHPDGGVEYRLG